MLVSDEEHCHDRIAPTNARCDTNVNRVKKFRRAFDLLLGEGDVSDRVIDEVRRNICDNPTTIDVKKTLQRLKLKEPVHHIHHRITGAPCHKVSEDMYQKIIEHHPLLLERRKDRRKFFDPRLVLYTLLTFYGHELDKRELFIPSTKKKEKDFLEFFNSVEAP